jgi:hypothetical protein
VSGDVNDDTATEPAPEAPTPDGADDHQEHPKGTMLIVFLMILAMAALWGWAYYLLVVRS